LIPLYPVSAPLDEHLLAQGEQPRQSSMDGVQFAPDCILPVQYFHRPQHSFSAGPEGKLMFAVFQDAIDCYLLNLNRTGRRAASELREVSEWFNAVNSHDLFAFETICSFSG
jgi:hypothetical protein